MVNENTECFKIEGLGIQHFLDKPTWAAAGGYDFNFWDCLSFCAHLVDIPYAVKSLVSEIPDIELREIYMLPIYLSCVLLALTWPLIFWVFAPVWWIRCTRNKRKYRHTASEVVIGNLESWKEGFDRRLRNG